MAMRFSEEVNLVSGIVPIDLAAGANNGDYVSMKGYARAAIIFFKAAGPTGNDPTVTVQQAQDVAGTGVKALNFTDVYTKQGTLTSVGTYTKTTQTAANTYTNTTSGENQAIWVIEFNAEDLDVTNGFDCFRATIADPGSAGQIGCVLYALMDPDYKQAALESAIVN